MEVGTTAKVIKKIPDWNKAACAEPPIGITGVIVHDDWTPVGRICLKVLSVDMGYLWSEEDDDPDREHIMIYVPVDCLETVL